MRDKIHLLSCGLMGAVILSLSPVSPAQASERRFAAQVQQTGAGAASFERMIEQAEAIAQDTANQAFADGNTTTIVVNITGEQEGQIAPILWLNVSSADWQSQPSIKVWASYPGGAKRLLGFERPIGGPPVAIFATVPNPIRDRMTEREANFYK